VNHFLYHYVLKEELFGSLSHNDDVRFLPKLGRDFGCDLFFFKTNMSTSDCKSQNASFSASGTLYKNFLTMKLAAKNWQKFGISSPDRWAWFWQIMFNFSMKLG
jgi:hypothetical protein